jgi:uncharacterized membrane protein
VSDFEDRFLWIVKGGVIASGFTLAAGLALHLYEGDHQTSRYLLALGLILLMTVPALRVIIATAERLRRRDWYFVIATIVVLVELSVTMWFAAARV